MTNGKLIVISAPSGAGKTTLLKIVMAQIPGLVFSISHTTRAPREGEKNGLDYHFVTKDIFSKMIEDEQFLEHADVHDNFYGTSKASITDQLESGLDVILDIDVQGAGILRNLDSPQGVFIFISPPGLKDLESRLRGRGTETEEMILVRLANAEREMQSAADYEYLIVNDNIEEAANLLGAIVIAERARAHRLPSGKEITTIVSR